uniref:Neurotransmitter-gated ion-channel ligand-binding domain-containing protein n=1 Tax=Timema monikensis TaxID=170555 RepID=A0A7R9E9F0_9NEOP|nr:unnamed protein product [Timema monikensis]
MPGKRKLNLSQRSNKAKMIKVSRSQETSAQAEARRLKQAQLQAARRTTETPEHGKVDVGGVVTGTEQGPHERRLLNALLDHYNTLERPVSNESEPLEVKFGLTLQQIIDVDEKNQILTTNAWLNLIELSLHIGSYTDGHTDKGISTIKFGLPLVGS